jgi:hypothetical protein
MAAAAGALAGAKDRAGLERRSGGQGKAARVGQLSGTPRDRIRERGIELA